MLEVKKKQRRALSHGRLWLLLGAMAAAAAVCLAAVLMPPPQAPEHHSHDASGVLASCERMQVQRLAVRLRGGESWTAVQTPDGRLTLEDDPDYAIDADMAAAVLDAARTLSYQAVLAEDAALYAERMADFGLDDPRVSVSVACADGAQWTLHIGEALSLEDSNAYYMHVEGDRRLFALDKGSAEAMMVERALLHPVKQPVLHKARLDRIALRDARGGALAEWTLQGDIGGNAVDRWVLTAPVRYPADGGIMSKLQDNLVNLRLGAYVGEATPENLKAFGFDAPRMTLEVHQAQGAIGATDAQGVYAVTDWPEETFSLTLGGSRNDMVDYVRVGEEIYLASHFTMEVFTDMDPLSTLSRYTVPVALGNLERLTIRTGEEETVYALHRTEQVAQNNELVTDSQGHVLYDISCTRNGEEIGYDAFASAYNELLKVTVSGSLPKGWTAQQQPHATYRFEAVTGEGYTLELTRFDAMHDAVLLDGQAVFYLIRDGMKFEME